MRPSTRRLAQAIVCESAAIIRSDLSRPPTVEELARRVATSPRQLHRAFTELAGMSVRSYVTEVRMREAGELLRTTQLSVAEVGRRTGYGEPSQFTKAFKRAHGVTPTEFRGGSNPPTSARSRHLDPRGG